MLLTQQCVSLDLAKKLAALGVKQESAFSWHQELYSNIDTGEVIESDEWRICQNPESGRTQDDTYGRKRWPAYSAYTTSELGEMLPSGFCTSGKGWMHDIGLEGEPKMPYGLMEKNEVNVRAKMLIHLIENKKIAL